MLFNNNYTSPTHASLKKDRPSTSVTKSKPASNLTKSTNILPSTTPYTIGKTSSTITTQPTSTGQHLDKPKLPSPTTFTIDQSNTPLTTLAMELNSNYVSINRMITAPSVVSKIHHNISSGAHTQK